jgi:transcription antitermination factor NusG
MYKKDKVFKNRTVKVDAPIYPGYGFFNSISTVDGVRKFFSGVRLLSHNGCPYILRNSDIKTIFDNIEKYNNYVPSFNSGDKVLITDGGMKGCKGTVIEIVGKKTYIAIELLGREIDCIIEDPFSIEKQNKDNIKDNIK